MASSTTPKKVPHYFNAHTIYIDSGVATEAQLKLAIQKAIKDASAKLGRDVITNFKVNVVCNRAGKCYGYSYVWFTNPEVYHMFLGRNPDGSERVVYTPDPYWIAPPPSEEDEKPTSYPRGKSWADIQEEEEEKELKYTRPMIKTVLEPLMVLSEIEYEPGQMEAQRQLMMENAVRNKKEGQEIVVPPRFKFVPQAAYVETVDDRYSPETLHGTNIPSWVKAEDIKAQFKHFASNSRTVHRRKVKGNFVEDTYPFVSMSEPANGERMAFVTFDRNTHDAQFALLMMRKVEMKNSANKCTIVFNHSFRSKN